MSAPADDPAPGVPEWVVTYGDMMSLLLTFFIMLVSLSEMKDDDGKLRAMMDAIREAFGPTQGVIGAPGASTQTNSAFGKLGSRGMRSEGGREKASRDSAGNAGAHRTVQRINHGDVITLGGPIRFAPFDASLTPEMQENLSIVADVIAKSPLRVVVRGHASPEPLPPDAPFIAQMPFIPQQNGAPGPDSMLGEVDQYDLSFARAHAVASFLIQRGIDPQRLVVSAAGDAEPRLSTQAADERKLNRRVDVFLIDSYITRPNSGGAARQ